MTRASALPALVAVLAMAAALGAQEAPSPRGGVAAAPVFQSWSFSTPLTQDTNRVSGVSQLALPLAASFAIGANWMVDVTGAYVRGSVDREGGESFALDGPSDVRVRAVGRVAGDQMLLTAGVTLPTGKIRLAGEELEAQRILGSPVLRLPVPALGTGFGATVGIVLARPVGPWALAVGTSYELRGEYQPIEAMIAGVASPTDLNPGDAFHVSFGADRLIGQHRLSLLAAGDLYGEDEITLGSGSVAESSRYKLGPTYQGAMLLDLAIGGFREFGVAVQARHRTAFTGVDGVKAPGSSGTVFDAGVRTIVGRPRAVGIILRADAMVDSGLEFDNSLATAGATILAGTVGLSIPTGSRSFEIVARLQTGQIDTGPEKTSALGLMLGATIGAR